MTKAEEWRNEWLEGRALEITVQRDRRVFITVAKDDFRKVMERLVKGFSQIAMITGIDIGEEIEVIYHLTRRGLVLSLRTRVPKEEPVLPTIVDLIPGSVFYEREVHELLGVTFNGNSDMSPLILPDGWPSDVYPLRKEWTSERIKHRLEEP
jgi:NADH:ubiquinone oxidoreductase subunit C